PVGWRRIIGIFSSYHGIGVRRNSRARHDLITFSPCEGLCCSGAGIKDLHYLKLTKAFFPITVPDRIPVHRSPMKRRIVPVCQDGCRQHPTISLFQTNLLLSERTGLLCYYFLCLLVGDHMLLSWADWIGVLM